MQTKQSTTLLKGAIITMSFTQMATNGIAPVLELIGKAFPEASATTVQFLMTFPSIFVVIFSLLAAVMASKLPQKLLALTGLALVAAAGLGACLVHGSITVLFVWAALIGIGSGMVAPIAPALVNSCFEGGERQMMLGVQNSSANIGSMLMTFFGGFLAVLGWQYGYLVYLVAVPGILLTCLGVSGKRPAAADVDQKETKTVFRLAVKREMAIAFFFLMLFSAIPANLGMLIAEKGIGGPALTGTMSTLYLLSGCIVGFFYGVIAGVLKDKTISSGALLLALGALLISFAPNAIVLTIGCLIGGASISLVMPGCMGAVAKMAGYETLGSALIMSCGNIGVFIAPVLTAITAAVRGSDLTAYRFQTMAIAAILLAAAVYVFSRGRK